MNGVTSGSARVTKRTICSHATNRTMDCDWQQTCVRSPPEAFRHYLCAIDPSRFSRARIPPSRSVRDERCHLWRQRSEDHHTILAGARGSARTAGDGAARGGASYGVRDRRGPGSRPGRTADPGRDRSRIRDRHGDKARSCHRWRRTSAARRPRAVGALYRQHRAHGFQARAQRERARALGADGHRPRAARGWRRDRAGSGHGRNRRSSTPGVRRQGRTSRCS